MADAYRDGNFVPTLIAVSNVDGKTPVRLEADPITHRLLVDLPTSGGTVSEVDTGTGLTGGPITTTGTISLDTKLAPMDSLTGNSLKVLRVNAGETAVEYATPTTGTVTTVSVVSANGLAGTVANATTTPAITLSTTVNSPALAGNGTAIAAATTTGSGSTVVLNNTPTLITPVLGVATATSINGNIFTTGSSTYTGTAAQTYTFPTTTATIARTDAAQTFTGTQTFSQIVTTNNAITATSNAATVPITSRISTVTNNSAATLTITITTTSAVDGMQVMVRVLDFSAVAQTITWVNTENSGSSVPTTSNGSTTLPLTVGFQFNGNTSKWRCLASA